MYTKLKTYKENILVPRNIEGRQNKLKQQAIKLLGQETIDGDFKLEKWMLDIPEHLIKVKTINGHFNCGFLGLTEFPKWFERLTINGSFSSINNKLTTLKNCPQNINGHFSCNNNELITLEGSPKTINGGFYCTNNKLISLKGCPQTINSDFDCSFNLLTSLKFGPTFVDNNYICDYNKVVKLKKPKNCIINGYFYN